MSAFFFFSSRRRHTRFKCDWSSDVCSSDLGSAAAMIERIVNIGFSRRGVVWLVFCFAALYGVFSWKQLPLEAYPDIADVTSQIVTQVPGLAAEEIERSEERRVGKGCRSRWS